MVRRGIKRRGKSKESGKHVKKTTEVRGFWKAWQEEIEASKEGKRVEKK